MLRAAKTRNGYSLIELMVVVAIVGVLISLAVPNFLNWNRKYQLKSDVANLAGTMAFARMTAINQNIQVLVTVSQAAPPAVVNVTFTNPAAVPPLDIVFPAITMNTGVSLTNAAGGAVGSPQTMRFNTMGMAVDTGHINNICTPGACPSTQVLNFKNLGTDNYRVVIKPTGKIVWCYTSNC